MRGSSYSINSKVTSTRSNTLTRPGSSGPRSDSPEKTGILIELLAITQWGELDVLVVDMPPGIADAALDAVRLLRRAEHLVVATGSRIVVMAAILNNADSKIQARLYS